MATALDTISYEKVGEIFKKTIIQDDVKNIAGEIAAIEAQISDMQAGIADTPEDQAKIDAAIANYQDALVALKA